MEKLSPGDRRPGFVDAHAHVFRPSSLYDRGVSELVPAERDAPVEDLLTVMAEAGVSNVVLVPLDGNDDYVASVVARYPGTFVGIAIATDLEHGLADRDPVQALLERHARYPFVALRTSWIGHPGEPIEASPMFSVLQYLADDGIPLWSYIAPDQLALLTEAIKRLPELRVVLNHLGFTPHDMSVDEAIRPRFDNALPASLVEHICALSQYPHVYLMVSGHYALSTVEVPYPDLFDATRKLAGAFGAERLLWGSDYPWTRDVPGYRATRDVVSAALPDLSADELTRVLGGTARSLFTFHSSPAEASS